MVLAAFNRAAGFGISQANGLRTVEERLPDLMAIQHSSRDQAEQGSRGLEQLVVAIPIPCCGHPGNFAVEGSSPVCGRSAIATSSFGRSYSSGVLVLCRVLT